MPFKKTARRPSRHRAGKTAINRPLGHPSGPTITLNWARDHLRIIFFPENSHGHNSTSEDSDLSLSSRDLPILTRGIMRGILREKMIAMGPCPGA